MQHQGRLSCSADDCRELALLRWYLDACCSEPDLPPLARAVTLVQACPERSLSHFWWMALPTGSSDGLATSRGRSFQAKPAARDLRATARPGCRVAWTVVAGRAAR